MAHDRDAPGAPRIRSKADPLAQGRMGDLRLALRHRRGDAGARDLLIERYMPLAVSLASRYRRTGEPVDDLVQVAAVGLVKAVDRWDPGRGLAFSSFAVPTMVGELRRYFRDMTWDVRPPRPVQELSLAVERAREQLHAQTGRESTVTDLTARLGRSREDVEEGLLAAGCRRLRSLDESALDGDAVVGDTVGAHDTGYERVEARATVDRLASGLDAREREVVRLRFEHDLMQSDIAERVGCSQVHVSRILKRAVEQMALEARLAA
jgi:RNA polymerase sigma-B factor